MVRLEAPPLSLYVHLPWCVRKCPYCDFNSHVAPAALPVREYVDALLDDLDSCVEHAAGRALESVFLGGGTPSLFPPAEIARLLAGVAARLPRTGDLEVTMEANPGTIERGRFAEYRTAGVNRVSLGAQSFDDAALAALGRIHTARETNLAVEELVAAGLVNFNIDLMYGLPDQDVAGALADLEHALRLGPAHISHYQLTLEPGTVFYRRAPRLPDDEQTFAMQLTCQAALATAGFEQYEVSAYARRGSRCRHNLNYWRFGDYLGIGAGAHGKWSDVPGQRLLRSVRCRQPRDYLRAAARADRGVQVTEVAPAERGFEFMLNALRLQEGFQEESFESRTGTPVASIAAAIDNAAARGLLESGGERAWRATELGYRYLNDLQAIFLP